MNCGRTTGLLSDRLMGLLTVEDERELETHLATCAACRAEADAVDALWTEMGALDDDTPHERMRARFHAALAAYEERARGTGLDRIVELVWPRRLVFQAGIAVALLVAGLIVGRELPSTADLEIAGLREDVRSMSLALLDHQSASERLRGVEWSGRLAANTRVVDALLQTVRTDSNVNVRLAAVEALSQWLDEPDVGVALTDALSRQEAPLMQVTLAEVLLKGRVDGSAAAVERMVEREETDPSVRDYLRTVLQETGAVPRGSLL